ncbi:MAG: TonB-dependent receptor [Acidobacteria bacterium]|nr:TonB-dependent receptor [Acidobacteriota bacterium]
MNRRIPSLLLLLAASAVLAPAQTTGTLTGRVVDPKGRAVAGARVTLSGGNLQGTRAVVSDPEGRYHFPLLPPGTYIALATKEGFNPAKSQIQVGLDRTATVDLGLAAVAGAVVEVVDTAAAVDIKGTTTGANFTQDSIAKLPTSRDFGNIALLAPGVTVDEVGLKVYGATGAENNYVVDGTNTTNVEFGTQGKRVPMEFIQEFQVKTGGYEAEFGKALGGIVNLITKSGGNEFSGDAFAYSEGSAFKSGNKHQGEGVRPVPLENKTFEFGFDAGGALIKDRLWYFLAYDRRSNKLTNEIRTGAAGQTAPTDSTRDLFAAKVTWKVAEGHTFIASVLGDPEEITGAVKTPQGPSSTWEGKRKVGGADLSLRYEVAGDNWFGQLQFSQHREKNSILPSGAGGSQVQFIDNTLDGAQSGGFGRYDDKEFTRDNVQGSFTRYFGSHELKVGFDVQRDSASIRRGFTGGQQVTIFSNPNPGTAGAYPLIYSHYYWTSGDAFVDDDHPEQSYLPSIVFTSKPRHESQAYFIQDKWSLNPAMTLNLGLRLDQTDIKNQFGQTMISLRDQWAPRLGFIWDFRGKGQDKLFLSLSRYYEQVPLDLVIRSFSVEINPTVINYSRTSTVINPSAESDLGFDTALRTVGSYVEPVDADLKGSYSDEFILGGEMTLNDRFVVGAKYIRRFLGRAIEDGLDVTSPLGDYFIMNPGSSHPAGVTYPKAIREYKGLEFSIQRKLSDRYTWNASYLWSKLEGNYEGAFQGIGGADGTGQLDPNINSAFDLPEFIVNSYGRLSGDRTHQFKANGYYEWSFGLSAGATLVYQSGTPISRLGYHTGYGRYELFLTPRGTEGRTPATSRLDLNLTYALKLANRQSLRFLLDVTNLLDSQPATIIDQRFNFAEGEGRTNGNYMRGFAFQAPRAVRLGLRYSF